MSQTKLFEPFKLGPITLPNRLAMAPLTRNRAVRPGMVPSPLAVDYYGQRASAGLLITEASQVSQQGQGYQDTPGIYSKEQVAGWRKVTDRVHEKGGRIFIQIWHVGRISHDSLQPGGGKPVAPSAIRAKGKTFVNRSPTSPNRARWSCRKFPGSSRISSAAPRMRLPPVSTASKFTAPTAICWISSRKTAPTSAPTLTADQSRTAPN
jgi:N-ethylmaleimide reductase